MYRCHIIHDSYSGSGGNLDAKTNRQPTITNRTRVAAQEAAKRFDDVEAGQADSALHVY